MMKISVVVPCFPPHIKYIDECIISLKKQTYKPDEVIIALSQTTKDEANFLLTKINDQTLNIIILPTEEKQYAGQNRNRGALMASNEIVSFIDVDDESHPQKLEIIKYVFETHNPKMFIHSYNWKSSKFEVYDMTNISIIKSNDIFVTTFGDPPNRNKKLEYTKCGQGKDQLKIPGYTEIHHGHVSIAKNIIYDLKYENIISGQDSVFCRDVLWKYNETLFSPLKLVNFKFDAKNCKNKCKWYDLDYDSTYG